MDITTRGLTKASGAAAAVAGAIFVAVQIKHPAMEAANVETTEWLLRGVAKIVMSALVLVGITGMYLRQHRQSGLMGLVGFALFSTGYLLMSAVEVISATVLPALAQAEPGYVGDALAAAAGGTPAAGIGDLQTVLNASGIGYLVGGLLFGIALVRTGVLARWAAVLLAVGTAGTAALAALPEQFNRPFAVPVGIALIGLGISLWRNPEDATGARVEADRPARVAVDVPVAG